MAGKQLAVLAVTIIMVTMALLPVQAAGRITMQVTNRQTAGNAIVHCQSKEDNLGSHDLAVGDHFAWSFGRAAFGRTLFWCDVVSVDSGKRLSFEAFHDYQIVSDWWVEDEGVFGKDIVFGVSFYVCKWNTGVVCKFKGYY